MNEDILTLSLTKKRIMQYLNQGKRFDGRNADEHRISR